MSVQDKNSRLKDLNNTATAINDNDFMFISKTDEPNVNKRAQKILGSDVRNSIANWTRNATLGALFPTIINDKVGIGTNAPLASLDIKEHTISLTGFMQDGLIALDIDLTQSGSVNVDAGPPISDTGSLVVGSLIAVTNAGPTFDFENMPVTFIDPNFELTYASPVNQTSGSIGDISISPGVIQGTGTLFTTQLSVNDIVEATDSQQRTVTEVISDTLIRVDSAFSPKLNELSTLKKVVNPFIIRDELNVVQFIATHTGKFGIGTPDPVYPLHVETTGNITGLFESTGPVNVFTVEASATSIFELRGGDANFQLQVSVLPSTTKQSFFIQDADASVNRLTISGDTGFIGINKTIPKVQLDVGGAVRLTEQVENLTGKMQTVGTTVNGNASGPDQTFFNSEVNIGDLISISSQERIVIDVISDSNLTVSLAFSPDITTDTVGIIANPPLQMFDLQGGTIGIFNAIAQFGVGVSAPVGTAHIRTVKVANQELPDDDANDLILENVGNVGYTVAPTVVIAAPPATVTSQATAVLISGFRAIAVTTPGTGYGALQTVPVTFTDETGTGLAAFATSDVAGTIASITVTAFGTGYTTKPTVVFGGTGSGAVGLTDEPGFIDSVTITNPGSGYAVVPTVTFVDAPTIGSDVATATAFLGNTEVITINMVNKGTGYATTVPSILLTTAPTAQQAEATANLVGGKVGSVTITVAGIGYKKPFPSVVFRGGNGSGAGVDSITVANSSITSIVPTKGGVGLTMFSPVNNVSSIDAAHPGHPRHGSIRFNHEKGIYQVLNAQNQVLIADSLGRIGVTASQTLTERFTVLTDELNVPSRINIGDSATRLLVGYDGGEQFRLSGIGSAAQVMVQANSGDLNLATRSNFVSNLRFFTSAGTQLAQAMIITSAGRVGIGTTTPTQALDVANGRVSGNIVGIPGGWDIRPESDGVSFGSNFPSRVSFRVNGSRRMFLEATTGNLGLDGFAPASAKLALFSTISGFLPPVMTTTQKDGIASPSTGLVVFDSDKKSLAQRSSTEWRTLGTNGEFEHDVFTEVDLGTESVGVVTIQSGRYVLKAPISTANKWKAAPGSSVIIESDDRFATAISSSNSGIFLDLIGTGNIQLINLAITLSDNAASLYTHSGGGLEMTDLFVTWTGASPTGNLGISENSQAVLVNGGIFTDFFDGVTFKNVNNFLMDRFVLRSKGDGDGALITMRGTTNGAALEGASEIRTGANEYAVFIEPSIVTSPAVLRIDQANQKGTLTADGNYYRSDEANTITLIEQAGLVADIITNNADNGAEGARLTKTDTNAFTTGDKVILEGFTGVLAPYNGTRVIDFSGSQEFDFEPPLTFIAGGGGLLGTVKKNKSKITALNDTEYVNGDTAVIGGTTTYDGSHVVSAVQPDIAPKIFEIEVEFGTGDTSGTLAAIGLNQKALGVTNTESLGSPDSMIVGGFVATGTTSLTDLSGGGYVDFVFPATRTSLDYNERISYANAVNGEIIYTGRSIDESILIPLSVTLNPSISADRSVLVKMQIDRGSGYVDLPLPLIETEVFFKSTAITTDISRRVVMNTGDKVKFQVKQVSIVNVTMIRGDVMI